MRILNQADEVKNIFRKTRPLAYVIFFSFIALLVRVFVLQVMRGEEFYSRSRDNFILSEKIFPARGEIFFSDGKVMASTEPSFKISIVPIFFAKSDQMEEQVDRLSSLIELSKNEKKLYVAALSVTANTEDARDAVADALTYAWEHRAELRDNSKLDAWLLRITYSQAKMIRRKSRKFENIDELDEAFGYESDQSQLEFFDILTRARLDDETRRILTLYFLYGYTMPEIAEMTGKNINTIKAKYFRALRKMADMKGLR